MVLEGDFYKIIEISRQENDYEVIAELSETHPIYAGHFPSQPVVPGMCTLTIIRECLHKILNRDIIFNQIKECKFVSALIPRKGLVIRLEMNVDQSRVRCMVYEGETVVLKLKAVID